MNLFSIILSCALLVQFCLCQKAGMYRMKGDYLDVPVKASYKIMGNDDDGFLEDGIIVGKKGTGYIDPRYRKREPYKTSASQIIYGRPVWIRRQ